MSKAKHSISVHINLMPDDKYSQANCSCGWIGPKRCVGEDYMEAIADTRAMAHADALRHSIEVVMAMPMLPDEYRSRFGTPE